MQLRNGLVAWSIILVCAGLGGCAGTGSSGGYTSYMGRCVENAKTEQERSECAWKNADRMASGN
jgi:hypothetical protein